MTGRAGASGHDGSRPVRVPIVGCGSIAVRHAEQFTAHPGFEVTTLVDPDPAAADRLSARLADHAAIPIRFPIRTPPASTEHHDPLVVR